MTNSHIVIRTSNKQIDSGDATGEHVDKGNSMVNRNKCTIVYPYTNRDHQTVFNKCN